MSHLAVGRWAAGKPTVRVGKTVHNLLDDLFKFCFALTQIAVRYHEIIYWGNKNRLNKYYLAI